MTKGFQEFRIKEIEKLKYDIEYHKERIKDLEMKLKIYGAE